MLISVAEKGVRVVVLDRDKLYDLDISHHEFEQKKSNIYKGKVSRVEPSLEAAFVDYGAGKHGFLPLKEISKTYFLPGFHGDFANLNIKDVIKEGQELVVQIEKEERGNKGAALTTFISLAGSYVVLMPNNPRAAGISRRIEGQERDEMRDILKDLHIPEDMGVIVRTAGIGKSTGELQWDLDMLLQLWAAISNVSNDRSAPFLVYQESDPAVRTTRDYLRENLSEIIVDNREVYERVRGYIELIRSDLISKVKLYEDKIPLFSQYRVEKQIEAVYRREVRLKSGGSIVIDHTEAMVCIDVNSARATSGSDIEETALTTNLEAADEIARQLRLRDIGGLIVIDFIDMEDVNNQRQVGQRLREALKHDRARVQIGNITRFGLLEMSRQRLRPHISEAIQVSCPRCGGQGTIRSIESLAYSIINLLEEEATKEQMAEIHVQVPIDLATYLLNEKRLALHQIETDHAVRLLILPNQHLETPKYKIKNIKKSGSATGGEGDKSGTTQTTTSYNLLETQDSLITPTQVSPEKLAAEPAVTFGTSKKQATVSPTAVSPTTAATLKNLILLKKPQTADKTSALKNILGAIKNVFLGKKEIVVAPINKTKPDNGNRKNYRRRSTTIPSSKKVPSRSGNNNSVGNYNNQRYKHGPSTALNKPSGSYNSGTDGNVVTSTSSGNTTSSNVSGNVATDTSNNKSNSKRSTSTGYHSYSPSASPSRKPVRRNANSDSGTNNTNTTPTNTTLGVTNAAPPHLPSQPQPITTPTNIKNNGSISGDIAAFYKPVETKPIANISIAMPPPPVSHVPPVSATPPQPPPKTVDLTTVENTIEPQQQPQKELQKNEPIESNSDQ